MCAEVQKRGLSLRCMQSKGRVRGVQRRELSWRCMQSSGWVRGVQRIVIGRDCGVEGAIGNVQMRGLP